MNFIRDDTYPLERDFLSDIANKTLWVAVNDSDEILGFAGAGSRTIHIFTQSNAYYIFIPCYAFA